MHSLSSPFSKDMCTYYLQTQIVVFLLLFTVLISVSSLPSGNWKQAFSKATEEPMIST